MPVDRPALPADWDTYGEEITALRLLDIAGDEAEAMANQAERLVADQFEAINANLRGYPAALAYTSGALTTVTYTTPAGDIVKALSYSSGVLTGVTLSGPGLPAIPADTKTLTYSGGALTGVTYS